MIISFSGIDSAGKTTQIEMLSKYCDEHKIKYCKVWSKARGTPGVLWLKELVRIDKKMDVAEKAEYRNDFYRNPQKQRLLYIASMLDLCWYWGIYYRILGIINKYLICDRYLWDTYTELKQDFQFIDIDRSKLWKIVRCISPKPKYSFVFIIPAEVSLERDKKKNAAGIEDVERKKRKIETYMCCVKNDCWTNVMDGLRGIDELHQSVLSILELYK